ncbi:MAG: sigma-70 family RNA polymerase sigma factor, partial [Moorea sp. SIO3C2]|nr:sigma-70 family RNA polymerase sigma factor [Moorena sp. SIO3C2]
SLTDEKKIAIRRAIDNLPARLHQTFILHFDQELSYRDIAQQQEISYQNVCKRISQARAILREELRGYFIGEDETDRELSVTSTNQVTESAIGEMSQGNTEVEPIVGETVTSSVAVEEVQEVVRSPLARQSPSVQHSESVPVPATSEGKLEVNKDSCQCVEAAVCERLAAPILALALFEEETGSRGNSQYCSVQREEREKKHTSHTSRPPHSQILPVLGKFLSGGAEEAITARDGGMLGRITATTLFSKLILPFQFLIPSHKSVRDRSELVSDLGDRFIIRKGSQESPRSPPTAEKTIKIQNSFPVVGVGDKKVSICATRTLLEVPSAVSRQPWPRYANG